MGTRPLVDREIKDLEKRLQDARGQGLQLNRYITDLEKKLQDGTAWCYEPKAFKQICREVEEKCCKWTKEDEQRDIARFGKVLTFAERMCWVSMPEEIINE